MKEDLRRTYLYEVCLFFIKCCNVLKFKGVFLFVLKGNSVVLFQKIFRNKIRSESLFWHYSHYSQETEIKQVTTLLASASHLSSDLYSMKGYTFPPLGPGTV